jgi:hypothetical protein
MRFRGRSALRLSEAVHPVYGAPGLCGASTEPRNEPPPSKLQLSPEQLKLKAALGAAFPGPGKGQAAVSNTYQLAVGWSHQ